MQIGDANQRTGDDGRDKVEVYRHMSHQTGATFAIVLFQTTELMNEFKQARPAQAMYKQVPTLRAEAKRKRGRQPRAQSMHGTSKKAGVGTRPHLPIANKREWHRIGNR